MEDKVQNKKYLAEIEVVGYFDLNDAPLNEKVKLLSKKEVSETEFNNAKQGKAKVKVCKAIKNKLGNLYYITEEGNSSNSNYIKLGNSVLGGAIGGIGIGILGGIGIAASVVSLPVVGVSAAIASGVGAIIGFFKD